MNSAFAILIFFVFLAIIAVAAYYAHLKQKKRREALRRVADSLGWRFIADSDYSHDDEFAHFGIFRQGHSRYAYNTLSGAVEVHGRACPAKMGDFHYAVTTSNGKTTTTHNYHFSYLIVHLPYPRLPDLLIRREGFFDGIKNFFGFPDIDFESAEFSRRFYVKCPDKRFAYDVIHAPVIEYLLAGDAPTIDIEHGCCCVADGRHTWPAVEFRQKLEWLDGFFDRWPEHVTSALAAR